MHELATAMRERGMKVERINICAGDRDDWPDAATNFRGRFRDWPVFFDNFLREHQITDILLFGDCRPYHVSARGVAALRGSPDLRARGGLSSAALDDARARRA